MEEARDMESDKNDIDDLIDSLRKEKDHLEMKVASLQEQLSKSMCEIVKLKEQLLHAQEECRVSGAHNKVSMEEWRLLNANSISSSSIFCYPFKYI